MEGVYCLQKHFPFFGHFLASWKVMLNVFGFLSLFYVRKKLATFITPILTKWLRAFKCTFASWDLYCFAANSMALLKYDQELALPQNQCCGKIENCANIRMFWLHYFIMNCCRNYWVMVIMMRTDHHYFHTAGFLGIPVLLHSGHQHQKWLKKHKH